MKIDSRKDDRKKKKKKSAFEDILLSTVSSSLRKTIDIALKDILKDLNK